MERLTSLGFEEIKQRVTIDEVLAEFGAELPYGGYYGNDGWVPLHCPFHDDRQASASINRRTGRFKCHACEAPRTDGRSGDIFDIVEWELGIGLREAVAWIEERFP